MFTSLHQKQGGHVGETLTPSNPTEDSSIAAATTREGVPAAPQPCVVSRRLKIAGAGEGRPRIDVPYVRLRGRWLARAGFTIGRHVRIEVGEARLTIEQVD
jgi:hypothetical protein